MRSIHDRLAPVFIMLAVGALLILQTGIYLGKGRWVEALVELVWVILAYVSAYFIARITIFDRIEELKESVDELEAKVEARENGTSAATSLEEMLKDAITNLPEVAQMHDEALDNKLTPIMREVFPKAGEGMPTDKQIESVKERFTELTGHYVKLSVFPGGDFLAEYFEEPFEDEEPKKGQKPAGKKIPVVDESDSAKEVTPPKRPLGNKKK